MLLHVIGAGVGRTGTYSLKLALDRLGLGPTHHMEEVIKDPQRQVPLWHAAAVGQPDWPAALDGYHSAVDWPTASFWHELARYFPSAKVILTTRSPEIWYDSFSNTILKLMRGADQAPAHMQPFMQMGAAVLGKAGVKADMNRDDLIVAFRRHEERVRDGVPPGRLLVYQVSQGWEPLCNFLGLPVPSDPFPVSNGREEFWTRLAPPVQ